MTAHDILEHKRGYDSAMEEITKEISLDHPSATAIVTRAMVIAQSDLDQDYFTKGWVDGCLKLLEQIMQHHATNPDSLP